MLLGARLLDQVFDVNNWTVVQDVRFTQGDSPWVYIQLVNLTLDKKLKPPGRRYVPQPGATLTVTLQNVNSANTLIKACTQPFTQDSSIWVFQILGSDGLVGSYTFTMQLTEGTVVTFGRCSNALAVTPQSGVSVPIIPQSPFYDYGLDD